jgi:hypothetical protein
MKRETLPEGRQRKNRYRAKDFLRYWQREGTLLHEGPQVADFKCTIRYRWGEGYQYDKSIRTIARFQVAGFFSYNIELEQKEWLIAETLYCGFSPAFEKYSLKKGGIMLRVMDGSDDPTQNKLRSQYKVDISPYT